MKNPSLLRANECWEPKVIPLLVVGYMTIIYFDGNIEWLLYLILADTVLIAI
jgi:hypothetical protein